MEPHLRLIASYKKVHQACHANTEKQHHQFNPVRASLSLTCNKANPRGRFFYITYCADISKFGSNN